MSALPRRVRSLRHRGIEIVFSDGNLRSYKKLIPTARSHPDRTIVTVDDDVLYPADWLEGLLDAHARDRHSIYGYRGTEIGLSRDGRLVPYAEWRPASLRSSPARVLLTGVGGILYPAGSLPEVAYDASLAMDLCPTADDMWFKAMALLGETTTKQVTDLPTDFPTIPWSQQVSLRVKNVGTGANERQLMRVIDHFGLHEQLGYSDA